MSKAGELNWDELTKSSSPTDEHVPPAQFHQYKPVGTLHKNALSGANEKDQIPAAPKNKPGAVPYRPTDAEIAAAVLHNAPRQPTDQELFGHLVKTEEEIQQTEKKWEEGPNKAFQEMQKNVVGESKQDLDNWGSRGSVLDELSEEERRAWRMNTNE